MQATRNIRDAKLGMRRYAFLVTRGTYNPGPWQFGPYYAETREGAESLCREDAADAVRIAVTADDPLIQPMEHRPDFLMVR